MMNNPYPEFYLTIKGPSVHDLVNHLSTQGWVFSSMAQTSFFEGYAIGYCVGVDAREFEGYAISTDQTRIARIDPIEE